MILLGYKVEIIRTMQTMIHSNSGVRFTSETGRRYFMTLILLDIRIGRFPIPKRFGNRLYDLAHGLKSRY